MGEQTVHPQDNIDDEMNGNENSDEDVSEEEDDMTQEEFDALNNQMDELNSALDNIEEKNDVIYAQLQKLLQESREIRKQMNESASNGGKEESSAKS